MQLLFVTKFMECFIDQNINFLTVILEQVQSLKMHFPAFDKSNAVSLIELKNFFCGIFAVYVVSPESMTYSFVSFVKRCEFMLKQGHISVT